MSTTGIVMSGGCVLIGGGCIVSGPCSELCARVFACSLNSEGVAVCSSQVIANLYFCGPHDTNTFKLDGSCYCLNPDDPLVTPPGGSTLIRAADVVFKASCEACEPPCLVECGCPGAASSYMLNTDPLATGIPSLIACIVAAGFIAAPPCDSGDTAAILLNQDPDHLCIYSWIQPPDCGDQLCRPCFGLTRLQNIYVFQAKVSSDGCIRWLILLQNNVGMTVFFASEYSADTPDAAGGYYPVCNIYDICDFIPGIASAMNAVLPACSATCAAPMFDTCFYANDCLYNALFGHALSVS